MKISAGAVALFSLLIGACAPEPVSTDTILESDMVKTAADAIRIGVNDCGNVLGERTRDPANWDTHLEKDQWVVSFKKIVSVKVAKSDGRTGDCLVTITAD